MSSPIVQPSAFSVSKVTISAPKLLSNNSKKAYLNYADSRSLVLQTPSLPSPFGLNVFDKDGPPKYSVDLAMRGYDEDPKVKSLFTALTALDEFMIDQGVKNSKLWFKSEMKREVVEAFYSPCVKFGKDKDGNQTPYPPNLKIKLCRNDNGEFSCNFYDKKSKGDPHAQPLKGVPIEEMLVKKVELTALIQCTGVWFAGGKFGLSWMGVQMRLDSVPAGLGRDAAFLDEEEFTTPAKVGTFEDSEEEAPTQAKAEVEEAEEDEEVAPAPVPKKTVMTKKKVVAMVKK
jgi:hypothetical protein